MIRIGLLCTLLLVNFHQVYHQAEKQLAANEPAITLPVDLEWNYFDNADYNPQLQTPQIAFKKLYLFWQQELKRLEQNAEKDASAIAILQQNLKTLKNYLNHPTDVNDSSCRRKQCTVYADIDKSKQRMLLYVFGELSDSFAVSTGMVGFTTPDMDLQPSGPLFIKYTSTKFPEGDYQGMGNMPYAVFIRGGYAIHGTTPGSFSRLGTPASHGCIRLHPDNAKIFFDLVTTYGLKNSWVTIHN